MSRVLFWAGAGTGFTFLMTALGAAMVFFFRRSMRAGIQKAFLGFASGVMMVLDVALG